MGINVYLNFNGNCGEALKFYGKAFDAEPKVMTFGDIPHNGENPMAEKFKDLVMHGNLMVCGSQIMFSDVTPDRKFVQGNNISISIMHNDKEQLKLWFERLSEGADVEMPLEKTFWSELYGCLTDKFGITWQMNCC